MNRRSFIKQTTILSGTMLASPILGNNGLTEQLADRRNNKELSFKPLDLHVHTTDTFTIEDILKLGEKWNVNFGIVEHPAPWALKNDQELEAYIKRLRNYPVYVGLQPTTPGWSKNYSKELLNQVDYILMDPQMVPHGNGDIWQIWQFDTYIADTADFMKRYMDYSLQILNNEPIHIFAWPLFLPVCISRDYYSLWTEERMEQIIDAARRRNIAIEINDMSHTPHETFIRKAKTAGLKFTFGSDSRNQNVGRLAFCRHIAQVCELQPEDFFVPVKKG